MTPTIIGFYSPSPGHGKTTAAKYLGLLDYRLISFAQPLRGMAYTMLREAGVTSNEAHRLLCIDKEEVIDFLGVSGRHILRTLGTEWGRDCISPDIWLRIWKQRISSEAKVVVDDVRFLNEAQAVKDLGGQMWKIVNPRIVVPEAVHASDGGLDDWNGFDRELVNDQSLVSFYRVINEALQADGLSA